MENIFKKAQYLDKFITESGDIVTFSRLCLDTMRPYNYLLFDNNGLLHYNNKGEEQVDLNKKIIAKINGNFLTENILDVLANKCYYELSEKIADVNCAVIKEAFKRGIQVGQMIK